MTLEDPFSRTLEVIISEYTRSPPSSRDLVPETVDCYNLANQQSTTKDPRTLPKTRYCSEFNIAVMAAANTMSSQQASVFPKSHVGFDSITSQIERKLLKRGFQFNVICVGMLYSVVI